MKNGHALYMVLILLLGVVDTGKTQNILAYDKGYQYKRIRWFLGDNITVKLFEDKKTIYQGLLTSISDSIITLNASTDIPIQSIAAIIDFDRRSFIRFTRKLLSLSSFTLLAVSSVNTVLQPDENNAPYLMASIAGIVMAKAMKPLKRKVYRIKPNHPIKILDNRPLIP